MCTEPQQDSSLAVRVDTMYLLLSCLASLLDTDEETVQLAGNKLLEQLIEAWLRTSKKEFLKASSEGDENFKIQN